MKQIAYKKKTILCLKSISARGKLMTERKKSSTKHVNGKNKKKIKFKRVKTPKNKKKLKNDDYFSHII